MIFFSCNPSNLTKELSERASLHLTFQGHLVRYCGFAACMKEREHLFQMLQDLKGGKKKAVNTMNWNNTYIHLFVHDIQTSKNFDNLLASFKRFCKLIDVE